MPHRLFGATTTTTTTTTTITITIVVVSITAKAVADDCICITIPPRWGAQAQTTEQLPASVALCTTARPCVVHTSMAAKADADACTICMYVPNLHHNGESRAQGFP
jgi:hypothetical protein